MNKLHIRLENVKKHADSINDKTIKVDVVGDAKAKKDLKKIERQADKLNRKNVFIYVRTNAANAVQSFRRDMGKLATISRDIGELIGRTFTSTLMLASSTGVASIGALAGVIGGLGPMLGALTGRTFALATAFGAAGAAAAGFGAVAFPSIKRVIEANSELNELQEKLANTSDLDKRAEIMKQIAEISGGLSQNQKRAIDSINSLSEAFNKLNRSIEPKVLEVFVNSMQILESLLLKLSPMIRSTADAMVLLSESLSLNINSKDFNRFISFLNSKASVILTDLTKGLGNFVMGLFNMMTAFGPAAVIIAKGFNEMGRSFREWAAGLSESEKFQKFVDYMLVEGDKLLKIFGGLTLGLVDMFTAFGPLASEMLDGLLDMTDGFREWASTLSGNPAFIEFTNWIRSHGPDLLRFFGELRDFLINVGIGFGQVSEKVTPFLTKILELTNAFMENNRFAGQFIAWLITLTGLLMNAAIALRVFKLAFDVLKTVFGPLISQVKKFGDWIGPKLKPILTRASNIFKTYLLPVLSRAWRLFLQAGPTLLRVGSFFLRFLTGPVGWVITGVTLLATIIYKNWDSISSWTKRTWNTIKNTVVERFNQLRDTIKTRMSSIREIISKAWDRVSNFFKAINLISLGIKIIQSLINGIKNRLPRIKTEISSAWSKARSYLSSINLRTIGRNIIQGLANGIGSMRSAIVDKAKSIATSVVDGIKSTLKIKSPSRVTYKLGQYTGEGISKGLSASSKKIADRAKKIANEAIKNLEFKFDTGKLDIVKYINALKKIQKQYKLTADQARKVKKEIHNANKIIQTSVKKINTGVKNANTTLLNKIKDINKRLNENIKEVKENYKRELESRKDSIYNQVGLFDAITIETADPAELLKNLQEQVKHFKQWRNNLDKLAKKGAPKEFVNELREMGISAAGEIEALTKMTQSQLNAYIKAWQQKHSLAKTEAVKQMEDQKKQMEQEIKQLTKTANIEINKAKTEWKNALAKLSTEVAKIGTFKNTGKVLGKNTVQGIINGLKNMSGPLKAQAKNLAKSIEKEIKRTLKIKSPSRVGIQLGEFTGQGVALGLINTQETVRKASEQMVSAINPPKDVYANTFNKADNKHDSNEELAEAIRLLAESLFGLEVVMEGEVVGRIVRPYVNEGNAIDDIMRRYFE